MHSAKLAQIKNWVMKTSCSNLINPLAQVIAKSYPGVSISSITLLLQQMVKEATTNSGQTKACQELQQLAYQILSNPHGIIASSVVIYVKQIISKKSTYDVVVKNIYKSSSGGSGNGKNGGSGSGNGKNGDNVNIDCSICNIMVDNTVNNCKNNAQCNTVINNVNAQLAATSGGKIDFNALQLASIGAVALKAANSPTGDLSSVTVQKDESLNLLKNTNGNLVPTLPISPGGPIPTESAATILPTSPNVKGATTPTAEGAPDTTAQTPLAVSGVTLPPSEGAADTTGQPAADTTAQTPLVVSGVTLPPSEGAADTTASPIADTTASPIADTTASPIADTTASPAKEEDKCSNPIRK